MLAILWTAVNLLMSNYFVTYTQITYGWFSQLRYLSAVGFAFDGVTQRGSALPAAPVVSCAGSVHAGDDVDWQVALPRCPSSAFNADLLGLVRELSCTRQMHAH